MEVERLKTLPLLKQIDEKILQECVSCNLIDTKRYKGGTTAYAQGDVCETLDFVIDGVLNAYSLSENGSAIVMFEFPKGSIIGANLLFAEYHEYPLNIYCLTNCEVLHIHREAVEKLLRDHTFVMRYIKSLSLNSQGMNRKIKMLTQKTLRENLLDYLKQQCVLQKSSQIILPMTKKELADYLGVQRPSLFREFKKLKEEGLIQVSNRKIKIFEERNQNKRVKIRVP